MAEKGKWKGTVTPLSSLISPEESRKAATKVAEAIAEKEAHLDHLHSFITDNTNIINLVKRLPDELHHDIMVPFGKAAFFPGRLVHTNEFLVLLGEGHYAERTSKQTVDILKRRGKTLDSQVDTLKGMVDDLRVEAKFFNSTAAEAEEGLVEIKEEYIEDDPIENTQKTGHEKTDKPSLSDDKDFAKMMARLDELEREEEEEEQAAAAAGGDDEELAKRISGLKDWVSEDQVYNCRENIAEKLNTGIMGFQSTLKGESPSKKDLLHSMNERSAKTDTVASQVNMGIQTAPKSTSKASLEPSKPDIGPVVSRPITDSLKAFSGSIIEHADNLPKNQNPSIQSQSSSSQSSKPVSRFRMQRR